MREGNERKKKYLWSVVEVIHCEFLDQFVGVRGNGNVYLTPPDILFGVLVEHDSLVLGRTTEKETDY